MLQGRNAQRYRGMVNWTIPSNHNNLNTDPQWQEELFKTRQKPNHFKQANAIQQELPLKQRPHRTTHCKPGPHQLRNIGPNSINKKNKTNLLIFGDLHKGLKHECCIHTGPLMCIECTINS